TPGSAELALARAFPGAGGAFAADRPNDGAEILAPIIVGDFLARLDRPQCAQDDGATTDHHGFRIRPAGMVGIAPEIAARRAVDRPLVVELEHVFGAEALLHFRAVVANSAPRIADDLLA